jgi:SAM-dependent methyltransferase
MDRERSAGERAELARVRRAYERYGRSSRKQRAWAADNPGNVAMRAELLAHVRALGADELAGSGEILDLGCGTGSWLRMLASHGVDPRRLHGVELLGDRAARARESVPAAQIVEADARRLPYVGDRFALLLCLTMLSSLGSRAAVAAVLSEARRVVRPGGLILVYEPRIPNPLNRSSRTPRRRELDAPLGAAVDAVTLTVVPPLSRRLGALADRAYPALGRFRPLRTHRLVAYRPDLRGPQPPRR